MISARFAFYHDGYKNVRPAASYLIEASDNPSLPIGGNVGEDQLSDAGVLIPPTPTYRDWNAAGRPVYRGQAVRS